MMVTMRFALLALLTGFFIAPSTQAPAQDYPTRIVHIIAPYGPGGPADVFSRVLAQKLSDNLKQSFVLENRPGASTMIGTDAVAKAVPEKTLKDFIALAKAKPGTMNYGSSGTGSQYHLTGELFKKMSGTDIVHVPYKGSTGARNDILGGQIEMMFDTIATMGPSVEAGLVRALGTTGEERSPILPDVPTISEAGVPGFRASGWVGIVAPAGTPKPIVERLNAEIRKVLNSTEIKESWAKQGVTPLSMTASEFGAFIEAEIEKWAKVAQDAGVKIN